LNADHGTVERRTTSRGHQTRPTRKSPRTPNDRGCWWSSLGGAADGPEEIVGPLLVSPGRGVADRIQDDGRHDQQRPGVGWSGFRRRRDSATATAQRRGRRSIRPRGTEDGEQGDHQVDAAAPIAEPTMGRQHRPKSSQPAAIPPAMQRRQRCQRWLQGCPCPPRTTLRYPPAIAPPATRYRRNRLRAARKRSARLARRGSRCDRSSQLRAPVWPRPLVTGPLGPLCPQVFV
jgi:hypothetical protein